MVQVDIPIVTVTPPLSTSSGPESPISSTMVEVPCSRSETLNSIEVGCVRDSKIISVSVYSGRAEVTRLLKIKVKAGHNQLDIRGLPSVLDQDSFRVEGRCSAVINDVTLSRACRSYPPDSSDRLEELLISKKRVEKALERVNYTVNVLDTYLASVNAQSVDVNALEVMLRTYESTAEQLDVKTEELETRKERLEKEIDLENVRLLSDQAEFDDKLNMQATIGIFSEFEGDVKIVIVYAVTNVEWVPHYDVRVDMQTEESPVVQLVYKATVTQDTGENWDNVPLSLETAKPMFGMKQPTISPWTLSAHKLISKSSNISRAVGRRAPLLDHPADSDQISFAGVTIHQEGNRSSNHGGVSAIFSIPGLINIPCDGAGHVVTIANLCLAARMSWLCIPKNDTRAFLKATIVNDSDCTLLKGNASVYVDGSFIFKTDIPTVVPDDTFECPLGIDPSIRVNYHPCTKKTTQSGFYTKTTCHVFRQPITVINSKRHAIDNLRIVDQFPISHDSTITVKPINPPLIMPSLHTELSNTGALSSSSGQQVAMKPFAPVRISKDSDVVAQWWHADEIEQGYPVDLVGLDGYIEWICTVSAGSQLGISLHYEVTVPVKTEIIGL